MNNNGFAMMRYFRDLGADAHLLLFANDGSGSLAHFRPEADTWNIDLWAPFIKQTRLHNWTTSVVPDARRRTLPKTPREIRRELEGFQRYVGNGASPAILQRAGMKLDIFYPYSTGVEWVAAPEFLTAIKKSLVNRPTLLAMRDLQKKGIANARVCLNAELGSTARVLSEISSRVVKLALPAVYVESETEDQAQLRVARLIESKPAAFRVMSSARIFYLNKSRMSAADWDRENKNSQYTFEGFRLFLDQTGTADARLYAVEYGPDVAEAKELVQRLGIDANVQWLPRMDRRELMSLLTWCHASVGEFYHVEHTIWGGTGWEALAAGTPFIQSVNFSAENFQRAMGYPLPPIMHADSPETVASRLANLYRSPDRGEALGRRGRDWFNTYNGLALARRWLDVLEATPSENTEMQVASARR